jgi:hypothetical protein
LPAATKINDFGNYFTSLLTGEMLQKLASLGSNAILIIVKSLEELRDLKRNEALQKVIFSSMETSGGEKSQHSLYKAATKVVATLMDHVNGEQEPILEVRDNNDIRKMPIFSFNFWK